MKRFFILASAAIVALASCAKTEVVYTEAPAEIGFKAFTGVMSRAPHSGTTMPTEENMVVYASYATEAAGTYASAFAGVSFEYDSFWKGAEAPQYWPTTGYMKFLAYYPEEIGSATGNAVDGVEIAVDDISTNQPDILYTALTAAQQCAAQPVVPMTFYHALAQIQVTAAVADAAMTDVRITSVEIVAPNVSGTLTLDGTTAAWSGHTAKEGNLTMVNNLATTDLTATPASLGDGALVVPGAATKLAISYTIDGLTKSETVSLTETWLQGKKYVYDIKVNYQEIKLSATVEDWTDGTMVNNGAVEL